MKFTRKRWKIELGRFTFKPHDAPYFISYKSFLGWKYIRSAGTKKRLGFKSIQEATQWIGKRHPKSVISCDPSVFEAARPKPSLNVPMLQMGNIDTSSDTCLNCGTLWGDTEQHAKVCLIGQASLLNDQFHTSQEKAFDLILDELNPAHAEQLRKGIRKIGESTIPGESAMSAVMQALSHDNTLFKAAYAEAVKRYPQSVDGLVWFTHAIGVFAEEPSTEALDWAEQLIITKSL